MSSVVNVKVAHIRPKYHDLEEWTKDPNNVYIGRAGIVFINGLRFPKTASIWANPFKMTPSCSRDQVLDMYEEYLINDPYLMSQLHTLQGKTLGCWCSPEPCHGDILLRHINDIILR